jgi:hypothetical protein
MEPTPSIPSKCRNQLVKIMSDKYDNNKSIDDRKIDRKIERTL